MRIVLAMGMVFLMAAPPAFAGYRVMVDLPINSLPAAYDGGCDQQSQSLPDIDGDGAAEMLAVSSDRQTFYILDALTGYVEFTLANDPGHGWSPMILDVDGNGRPDVFLGSVGRLVVVDFTGIADATDAVSPEPSVRSVTPNPFSQLTSLSLALPGRGRLEVKVVDVSGRLVRDLFDQDVTPGTVAVLWDGQQANGQTVASGLYFFETRFNGKRLQPARVVLTR